MTQAFVRMFGLVRLAWVRVILAVVFLEGALCYGSLAFAAYHAHRNLGLGIAASGMLMAAFAGGGLLYAAVAGRLVPKIGERGLVIGGGIFLGTGYAGLALAPTAVTCSSSATTNIAFTVSGGTSPYIWSLGDTSLGTLVAAETTAIYTSKKAAGVNTVIVTDAVTNSASATVTQE